MLRCAFKAQEPAISSYPKQHFSKSLSILLATAARGLTERGGDSLVAATVSWQRHGGVSRVIPQKRDLDAIIGTGRSLRHTLSHVESMVTTDSAVLILV